MIGGMNTTTPTDLDPFALLRNLTLAQVEQRITDLDAERAQLANLRQSMLMRERARRRREERVHLEELARKRAEQEIKRHVS
jgi:hypothetical protein